jgi:Ca-activated chloride channel family protein
MAPLGAALVLLVGYHVLMLLINMLLRIFSGRRQIEDEATSDVFKVHV